MNTPVYIAGYHQSEFGKLMGMTVPDIIRKSVTAVCRDVACGPASIDVGAVGATCHFTLNQQGLLAGLVAEVPGLAGKPIEAVENACATGGQAVLATLRRGSGLRRAGPLREELRRGHPRRVLHAASRNPQTTGLNRRARVGSPVPV